jgi:hypothetical protein
VTSINDPRLNDWAFTYDASTGDLLSQTSPASPPPARRRRTRTTPPAVGSRWCHRKETRPADRFDIETGSAPISAVWRGESDLIGEDDETWDEVVMLARDLKSIKVIHRTVTSWRGSRSSTSSTPSGTRSFAGLRWELDAVFLRSDGTGHAPVGLPHATGR